MKKRINPVKHWWHKIYWWWRTRYYEQDPERIATFYDWLNIQDMHLARWEVVGDNQQHQHYLLPLDMEETEAILERYLAWRDRK